MISTMSGSTSAVEDTINAMVGMEVIQDIHKYTTSNSGVFKWYIVRATSTTMTAKIPSGLSANVRLHIFSMT